MGRDRPAAAVGSREEETDEALRALAEPRRRAILQLVAQLGALRGRDRQLFRRNQDRREPASDRAQNAGLLTERRLATRRLYRARPEGLARACVSPSTRCGRLPLEVARDLVEADRGAAGDGQASAAG